MTVPDDLIITVNDVHPYHCAWGMKTWFDAHGIDFKSFLEDGVPAKTLLDTGDLMAENIVRLKLENADEQ